MKSNAIRFNIEAILYLLLTFCTLLDNGFDLGLKYVNFILLGLVSVFIVFRSCFKIQFRLSFFIIYLLFIIVLLLRGLYDNNFISFVLQDVFSFASIFLVFIIGSQNTKQTYFFSILPKLGMWINVIGIVLAILYIFKYGLTYASVGIGRGLDDAKGNLFSPKYLMYGSLFFYPLIVYVKSKFNRFIFIVGITLFIIFGLFMSSRGTTVIALLTMFLTHYMNGYFIPVTKGFKNIIRKFRVFFILLISFFSILFLFGDKIINALEFLILRFNSEAVGSERMAEAEAVLRTFSMSDYIVGRGFGAANNVWMFSGLENGVNNVHFGWLFLVLKGGFFLLILIYGKIIKSIIRLWKIRKVRPYAIILIIFLFTEFSHNNFNNYLNLSIMFIALTATNLCKNENSTYLHH